MEKFEQFFKENRLRLDTEDLDNASWKNIENSFKQHKRRRLYRQIYVAASIIIILGLSSMLFNSDNSDKISEKQISIFNDFSPELAEQEVSYMKLINNKIDLIKEQKIPKENAELFEGFIEQLKVIDKQYELYKTEIKENGYNEDLIQQIIYNYQLKLNVLQMLQSEINKINNLTKKNKDEKNTIKIEI